MTNRPLDPTVKVTADKMPQGVISNGYFIISYRQHVGGSGLVGVNYTIDGLVYSVQVMDGLPNGARVSGTNYVEWTGNRADNGDGAETVSVRIKQPASLFPRRFARLTIQQTQP